ncbi:MAG TPA: hypothetical protein VJB61_03030 [Actinomycetota bacterium]
MFRRRAHDQPERAPAGTRYLLREKMLTFSDDFWIEYDTRDLSAAPDSRRTGTSRARRRAGTRLARASATVSSGPGAVTWGTAAL